MTMTGAGLLLGAGGCATARRAEPTRPGQARLLECAGGERLAELSGSGFTLDSPFRIASVSKVLVAELARRLHAQGRLDMDADAGAVIGFDLRHPDFLAETITLRRLVSHRSGIIDPPVYWMALGGDIRDLLVPDMWETGARPGRAFRYSNLNYGLAATVMEAATGERFDHLFTQEIARPLGLDIGFNWSGVSAAKRAAGAPAQRRIGGQWVTQVDGPNTLGSTDPAILVADGGSISALDDYVPGTNGTLFSPQGGLRASCNDLAVIGREIILAQPDLWQPGWRAADTDGRGSASEVIDGRGGEAGHFVAFGEGLYIYPDGPLPGRADRAWIGHHGEAYGVYCGLWVVPERGEVFVHADLGSPENGSPLVGGLPNQTVLATNALGWAAERMDG
jgi:CubicO group peptidase (beta-lactamase class C family)